MIKPMLAVPMDKGHVADWNDWVVEEKYDGHRLIVSVTTGGVTAWTRPRRRATGPKTMDTRKLPPHLIRAFTLLPLGVYDGELLAGQTSTDVTRLDLQDTLEFVVFDVLQLTMVGGSTLLMPYSERRRMLEKHVKPQMNRAIRLSESVRVLGEDDVFTFVHKVWARGGEGAILKRRSAYYQPGKRSTDWIKIKKLQTAVCTVVGFEPTRGEVLNRGPYAIVVLEDERGRRTKVKTLDDTELARFNKHRGTPETHPALGRKLRIEFQDYTPDGDYRHPRWDRWEKE